MIKKKKSLPLWQRASLVAGATAISDYIWAQYMGSVAKQSPFVAANWSFLIIILGALIVVSYVNDKRLILAAAIGAWIGTYFGVY